VASVVHGSLERPPRPAAAAAAAAAAARAHACMMRRRRRRRRFAADLRRRHTHAYVRITCVPLVAEIVARFYGSIIAHSAVIIIV
jgi:hypothetical protein